MYFLFISFYGVIVYLSLCAYINRALTRTEIIHEEEEEEEEEERSAFERSPTTDQPRPKALHT